MTSSPGRSNGLGRSARRAWMFGLSLLCLAVLWELYKLVGPAAGGSVLGVQVLPKSTDLAMPHTWDMVARYARADRRGSSVPIIVVVFQGAWFSLRLALAGFVMGTSVGLGLAVLMARYKVIERGLLPYLVVSQTVPLIALAPLVVSWGGRLSVGSFEWPRWLSAAVLGAFLAFFPVAVGTLKGLTSTPPASLELMDSYAAPWRTTLVKLRFPAAVPFIIPSLRLAASASVIGVVVAEISTGLAGGVGRLIIEYAREVTGDPPKVYTAVFGAALLGIIMAGLVAVIDSILMRHRPKEAPA